ncbi:hypothetical protein [Brevibacillus brevis]|nr:hypothetical protein [Brevibacillus brevis]
MVQVNDPVEPYLSGKGSHMKSGLIGRIVSVEEDSWLVHLFVKDIMTEKF